MAPKYFFLVFFEWVTWGSEYYELHLEVCVHVYIFISGYARRVSLTLKTYIPKKKKSNIPYTVIW